MASQHINKPFKSKSGFISDNPIINTNTDYNIEPGGTTEQRPSNPQEKSFRINTTIQRPEIFINGQWSYILTSEDIAELDDSAFFYAITLS